jgi:hypothetical protein
VQFNLLLFLNRLNTILPVQFNLLLLLNGLNTILPVQFNVLALQVGLNTILPGNYLSWYARRWLNAILPVYITGLRASLGWLASLSTIHGCGSASSATLARSLAPLRVPRASIGYGRLFCLWATFLACYAYCLCPCCPLPTPLTTALSNKTP